MKRLIKKGSPIAGLDMCEVFCVMTGTYANDARWYSLGTVCLTVALFLNSDAETISGALFNDYEEAK